MASINPITPTPEAVKYDISKLIERLGIGIVVIFLAEIGALLHVLPEWSSAAEFVKFAGSVLTACAGIDFKAFLDAKAAN